VDARGELAVSTQATNKARQSWPASVRVPESTGTCLGCGPKTTKFLLCSVVALGEGHTIQGLAYVQGDMGWAHRQFTRIPIRNSEIPVTRQRHSDATSPFRWLNEQRSCRILKSLISKRNCARLKQALDHVSRIPSVIEKPWVR
jgi:hypothetical protein